MEKVQQVRKNLYQKLQNRFSGDQVQFKDVMTLLFPVIIDQFFLVSFNFINTAMISSSGTAAISAVNMVGTLNVFLVQIFQAVGLGGTVLIAQAFGAKNYQRITTSNRGTVQGAVLVATTLSIAFLFLHQQVIQLLFGGAEQAVLENAEVYMTGILLSYPLQAIVEGTNGSLRGVGRTRSSLKLSLLMNSFYILFNFVFVLGFKMGIIGLVISLNISRLIGAIFGFVMLYLHREIFRNKIVDFFRVNLRQLFHVLTVSIPFAMESMFFSGGKIIIQTIIVSLGTNVIATNAIASSWVQLSEIIPTAMGSALVPIVGQCIGAKNLKDARKLTKSFVAAGSICLVTVDLLLLPLFPLGMKLFNPPAEIIPDIFQIILIVMVFHGITWSVSFVLPAALRAAGDSVFTTVTALLSMWIFRVGLGYLVGLVLGYGLPGIFFVMAVEWGVRGSVFYWRFRGDKWYQREL